MKTLDIIELQTGGGRASLVRTLLKNEFLRNYFHGYLMSARLFSSRFPLGTLLYLRIK